MYLVIGVLILMLWGGVIVFYMLTRSAPTSMFHVDAVRDRNVGEKFQPQNGVHINPPQNGQWSTDPPTSGQHYSLFGTAPASWGFHSDTVPPEDWVHNLEHGGIGILYSCAGGCSAQEAAIRSFIDHAPGEDKTNEVKLISTRYSVPGHPIALVAWGWRLFLDSWDPVVAKRFYEAHADQAPELVP